jgi:hypothetical protein
MDRIIKRGRPSTVAERNAEAEACIKALRRAGIDITLENIAVRMARKLSEGKGSHLRYLEALDRSLLESWGFNTAPTGKPAPSIATRVVTHQRYFGALRGGRRRASAS